MTSISKDELKKFIFCLASITFILILIFLQTGKTLKVSAQSLPPSSSQLKRVTMEKLTNGQNKLFFAYVRNDNTPMTRWYDANTNVWSDWKFGGSIGQAKGNVSMMEFNGKLYQAVRGYSDDAVYTRTFDGTNWSGWISAGASTLSNMIAMETYGGKLYQAIRGTNNVVFIRYTSDGTNWSGWSSINNGGTIGEVVLEGFPGARLFIALRGTDEQVYISSTTDGLNWSSWDSPQPGAHTEHNIEMRNYGGRVYQSIGYKDPGGTNDKTVYTRDTDPSNVTWTSWYAFNSSEKARGDIFMEASSQGILYQAAVGQDNIVYSRIYNGANWTNFGSLSTYVQANRDIDMEDFNGQMYISFVDEQPGFINTTGPNSWSSPQVMTATLYPDLQPTNITYTATPTIGQPMYFQSVVRNNGGTESKNFNVKWTMLNTVVGEVDPHANVPGQTTSTGGSVFMWQPTQPGTYTLQLEVDSNLTVNESNETNNIYSIQLQVGNPQPDFKVNSLTINTTSPLEGNSVRFQSNIINQGNASASNINVRWYIDGQIFSNQTINSLAAGDLIGTNSVIDWTALKGSHTIKVVVDESNQIAESNETNNSMNLVINVSPKPDMVVQFISYDSSRLRLGNTIQLDSGVYNAGEGDTGTFNASWYIKGPSDSSFHLFQSRTHASILGNTAPTSFPDASNTFQWTPNVSGTYTLRYIVDELNMIGELNENNNLTDRSVFIVDQPNSCDIVGINGGQGVGDNGVQGIDTSNDFITRTATDMVRINFRLGPYSSPDDTTLYDGKTWQQNYDNIVNHYVSQGVKIYALVGAESVKTQHNDLFRYDYSLTPDQVAANNWINEYGANFEKIVNRYGDRVKIFESFNEPNPDRVGGRVDASWFAIMLERLNYVRQTNISQGHTIWNDIKLISGPLETIGDLNCTGSQLPGDGNCGEFGGTYMKNTYDFGASAYGWTQFPVDGFGLHMYVQQGDTNTAMIKAKYDRLLNDFWDKITSTGEGTATSKRVWLSEFGWNAVNFSDYICVLEPPNPLDPNAARACIENESDPSYQRQANNMTFSFNNFKSDARIAKAFWYSALSYVDPSKDPIEQYFGLFTHTGGKPKLPVANAFINQVCNPSKVSVTANFTAPTSARINTSVKFTDKSTAVKTKISSWSWTFGDGGHSGEQNPLHIYRSIGTYIVRLTVSDGIRSNTIIKSIRITQL